MSQEDLTTVGASTSGSAENPPLLLLAGLSMPKPLRTEGNLAANWKKFKRSWDNYAIVARLNRFEDGFKTATFLSCIGDDAMEIYEGMDFASEQDCMKLDIVINKFKELCLGETNETYERFMCNSRQKKDDETVEQYITALRTLGQTCNFCVCLKDSLVRDRLVIGINDTTIQKKLLQDRRLTLSKAIDICRSSESTKKQIRTMQASNESEVNAINNNNNQTGSRPSGKHEKCDDDHASKTARATGCRYCGGKHARKKHHAQHLEPVATIVAIKTTSPKFAYKKE